MTRPAALVEPTGTVHPNQLPAGGGGGPADWNEILNRPSVFPSASHTHAIGDVSGLQPQLDAKAPLAHIHGIGDVASLQPLLDAKASVADFNAHVAAADPHTGYQRETEKGQPNGYASLDGAGLVPLAQLPQVGGGGQPFSELFMPWAWHGAANLTTVTAYATNITYFLYIGKAQAAYSSIVVRCRVATAVAGTITWAEVGVFKGAHPAFGVAATLTRVGFLNVATTFNSTGQKTVTVNVSGVAAGDDLWIAYGSQATTPYQLRAGLADDLQTGSYQQATGRISTLATPVTAAVCAATLAIPMLRANPA